MRAATRKSICLLLGALVLSLSAGAFAQQTHPRIGYVDMKRLLDQAPQVQQAHDQLQAEFADRNAALQKQQARLQGMRDALADAKPGLDPDAVAERQHKIDLLAHSVRRARERMQADLKQRSSQELDKSWQTINNAAVDYARKHGYDLLLPSPVIYASPRVDITDQILQELRREAHQSKTSQ